MENVGNNNTNSTFNIFSNPQYQVPKILTPKAGNKEGFIGRVKEIAEISQRLHSASSLLLLNGIGGIGKSTLASYYLSTQKENFDYYGLIEIDQDIKDDFSKAFDDSLLLSQDSTIDKRFNETIVKLRNLEGKKLLVIDNIQATNDNQKAIRTINSLSDNGFTLLFTSRQKIETIPQYRLDIMNQKDARELFTQHFETDELDKVDKILVYLDNHTLFIELFAKTIGSNGYSLDEIIAQFESGELAKIEYIDEMEGDEKTINHNLTKLFNLQGLQGGGYIELLQKIAVLPSIEIDEERLIEMVETKRGKLNFLVVRGWLIEGTKSYKLHQIIKEYLLANHTPTYPTLQTMVEHFTARIAKSANIQTAIDVREDLSYFESVAISMERLRIANETVANLDERLGNIYRSLGEYSKALLWLEQSLAIREKVLGLEHPDTATSYNNIGAVYQAQGEYSEALRYYQKALAIREKALGLEHPDTATSYNNIGEVYRSIGEYNEALGYHQKALAIREKVLGLEHPDTAQSYNNIGLVYDSKGEYNEALRYYQKDLAISEKVLGLEHPSTATSYNNIGAVYQAQGEYNEALRYFHLALAISEKVLGLEHPDTAQSYNNIAILYYKIQNYPESARYMQKAVDIREKVLPANHPYLIGSKEGLATIKAEL